MPIDGPNLFDSLFRWTHVVAGILWIGLLYFFNWVNTPFAATMDADTKKKVVPQLMPRALFWFRWGAAVTWLSGVVLLLFIYYYQGLLVKPEAWAATLSGDAAWMRTAVGAGAVVALIVAALVYDLFARTVLKAPPAAFWLGWILASLVPLALNHFAKFEFRGYAIHLGAMFGTFMAFNVWMRIWPAQRKIISATKAGEAADAALVALAGLRSRHNAYMSVPLVFTMISQHSTWAKGSAAGQYSVADAFLPLVILVGWVAVYLIFQKAKKVPGF